MMRRDYKRVGEGITDHLSDTFTFPTTLSAASFAHGINSRVCGYIIEVNSRRSVERIRLLAKLVVQSLPTYKVCTYRQVAPLMDRFCQRCWLT